MTQPLYVECWTLPPEEEAHFLFSSGATLQKQTELDKGQPSFWVDPHRLFQSAQLLKETGFHQLTDICGVDYPSRPERFEVVYHFLNLNTNLRVRLKVPLPENEKIISLIPLYPSANWWERELFDMFGIKVKNHPDLRRILTDYGFEGFPLRKDFPMTGYTEVHYDEKTRSLVYKPVDLAQDFRIFETLSPWEGYGHYKPGGPDVDVDTLIAPELKEE